MKKKILLPLLVCLLTSCNASAATLLKEPEIKYNRIGSYDKNEYDKFIDTLNTFSSRITEDSIIEFNEENKNFSVSPLSLYMALSLVVECSNGDTRQEILDEMGLTYEQVSTFTKTLFELSTKQATMANYEDGTIEVLSEELVTNSIWIDDEIALFEKCLDKLALDYYCYSHKVDFNNNNKDANKRISKFVKEQTKGLIDSDFAIDKDAAIALINTLYLKFNWLEEGEGLTYTSKEYEFLNHDNSITNTKLVKGDYWSGRVHKEDTFSSFFTKNFNGYKLQFIVPNDGYTLSDVYTKENIDKMIKMDDYQAIDDETKTLYYTKCLFPEFETSCDIDYVELLSNESKYNINKLFGEADFSNLVDYSKWNNSLYCDRIIHQTKLNVEKKGVEGAAVTVVLMNSESAIETPQDYKYVYEEFEVTKNYGFILTDRFDSVIFTGVVNNV